MASRLNIFGVSAAGDFAATTGCAFNPDAGPLEQICFVEAVRFSTNEHWRINSRPGMRLKEVLAVSPTEILVGEMDWPNSYPGYIQRLLRFSTADLDALAAAW